MGNKASLLQQRQVWQLRDLWGSAGPVLHPAGKHVAGLDVVGLRHGQQGVRGQRRTWDQVWLCWLLLAAENSPGYIAVYLCQFLTPR